MSTPVIAPAAYVAEFAVAFSDADGAIRVGADTPMPIAERSFQGVVPIVPDVEQPPRRGIAIVASLGGDVRLKLADASSITVPVTPGLTILPFAVVTVMAGGTNAVANCFNLI